MAVDFRALSAAPLPKHAVKASVFCRGSRRGAKGAENENAYYSLPIMDLARDLLYCMQRTVPLLHKTRKRSLTASLVLLNASD